MTRLTPFLAFALAAGGAAAAPDDPLEMGRSIAEQWCASCHVATPDQTTAPDIAPSFMALANDREMTPERLRSWIAAPHPPMPDPGLSRTQIADVALWIESLREE